MSLEDKAERERERERSEGNLPCLIFSDKPGPCTVVNTYVRITPPFIIIIFLNFFFFFIVKFYIVLELLALEHK